MNNNKKFTFEEVKKDFENKNYTLLETEYINSISKMKYICNIHEEYGEQFTNYTCITKSKNTCYKCKALAIKERQHKNKEYREKECKPICDILDLIYVDSKTINGYCFIGFICKKHKEKGIQYTPKYNLKKAKVGCKYCTNKMVTIEDLKNHKGLATNVEVIGEYIKSNIPIECRCKICGNQWKDTPNHLQSGRTCSCVYYSIGERRIADILSKFNIKFIPQYNFVDCVYKNKLFFDFYLPEYNICIEYNGVQHYESVEYFGGEEKFNIQQERDDIKREYCKENNIKLIEIPYWEFKNIKNIIKNNVLKSLETAGC